MPASGQISICVRLPLLNLPKWNPPIMKTNFRIGLPLHVAE